MRGVAEGYVDRQGAFRRVPIYTHGGAINGFAADVYWLPTLDFAFITLASTDGAYFRQTLEVALANLAPIPTATTPPDLAPRPGDLDRYVGHYLDPYSAGRVDIAQEDGALVISMPDVDAAGIRYDRVLAPGARHNFVLSADGQSLALTFLGDEGQPAEFLRGRPFVARRAAGARAAPHAVDPTALRARWRVAAQQPPSLLAPVP